MEFYDNFNKNINEFFSSIQYNKLITKNLDNETITMFFEEIYKYPNEISKLIIEDKDLVLCIINRFRKIINEYINNNLIYSFEQILEVIDRSIITILNTQKKIKFNRFEKIIKEYLVEKDWFYAYYDDIKQPINIIDLVSTLPIRTFNRRLNQTEAHNILYKKGIQSGIHCQATGTGKSYIMIDYVDYSKKMVNSNCKIILFTERVNILKDLFDFKDNKLNENKLIEWRENGIGDLTDYDIIDRVTIKKKNWVELLNKAVKPTLLVINRAYLTLNCNSDLGYKKINNLDLIIHDECHNSTSDLCYNFLKYFKDKKVPIVGFSATPLRNGKTDGEFNKDKLIEIFSDNMKLNLLTDYNMIYSIEQQLILPPKFYWYNMDSYQTDQTKKEEMVTISEAEIGSIMSILNEVMDILPNKKIIAWCGTIKLCEDWCSKFNEYKKKLKNIFPEIYKIETFVDISSRKSDDYQNFRDKNSFAILFCAQKHREGSDIEKLDCCIFLDKVKNRSSIPFIQSIGRVLRIDSNDPNKTCGIIIDGVVKNNEQYEKIFIDKIFGYYVALANLTNVEDSNNTENKYEIYIRLRNVVKIDKENKIININVANTTIPINCKKLDWDKAVSNFNILLERKVNLTPDEAFYMYIEKVKLLEPFKNPDNDFWKEYNNLDHELLELPNNIHEPYKHIWETKTWYDLLGFTNRYYNYNEFKEYINENKIDSEKKLHKYLRKQNCNKFPYYPNEYYRLSGWTNWKIINNNDLLW